MIDQITICEALAKRNETDPFFKQMVTEDERTIFCENDRGQSAMKRHTDSYIYVNCMTTIKV